MRSSPISDTNEAILTHEGRVPDAILIAGWGRCLRAASQAAPGRLRASCPPVLRPVRGVHPLDWHRRKAGNAAAGRVPGNLSQATWPEVEKPRPRNFGQSRGGAPRGERARSGRSVQTDFPCRAPRPKRERVATAVGVARSIFSLRLPALRLPSFYLEAKLQWLSFLLQNSGAHRAASTISFTLPWRGRVAHRRCAGWGARRCRGSQRAARAFTPTRRPSGVDLPPPGEGGERGVSLIIPSSAPVAWLDQKERKPPCKNAPTRLRPRRNIAIGTSPPRSWSCGPIAISSNSGAHAAIGRAGAPAAAAA